MSGFVLIFNRNGAPVDPQVFEMALSRLDHRGPDGKDTLVDGALAFGHQRFWVTPEEIGEGQPLTNADGHTILFNGRLDNRADLLVALGVDSAEGKSLSDAALVLRAYAKWETACFEHLLGPAAIAIYDSAKQRVVLARDALGDRTLFYHVNSHVLVVASEPYAVLAHPDVSAELNESTIVFWYAVQMPENGDTFFRDVTDLLPAHVMTVSADSVEVKRYWELNAARKIRYRSDEEYAEHFLELLTASVRAHLRSTTPPAIMMSGGYDSTSVAALAARDLAHANGSAGQLRAISWVYDKFPQCDERPYIEAVCRHYGIESTYLMGDDAWALRDLVDSPHNPSAPDGNAYRFMKTRMAQVARELGTRTILTGSFGNNVFASAYYWLFELLAEFRVSEALKGLRVYISNLGWRHTLTGPSLRRVVGGTLDRTPGIDRWRQARRERPPDWLTPYAAEIWMQTPKEGPPSVKHAFRPTQHHAVLGAVNWTAYTAESFYTSLHDYETRHPYRSLRLAEFMLALPASQLYKDGHFKYIVYKAMQGILPEEVRQAQSMVSLFPLYNRGFLEEERATVQEILNKPGARWRRYVRPKQFSAIMDDTLPSQTDGSQAIVPWQCVSMELWSERNTSLRRGVA
jgi:asparagine synthase (glutamine-hydrolysing)